MSLSRDMINTISMDRLGYGQKKDTAAYFDDLEIKY